MSFVIDAHQHFWKRDLFDFRWLDDPKLAAIRRDFLPSDLQPHLAQSHVDFSIFVQTQHNTAENDWVLNLADQNPWIAGVVGWVDLASPECEKQVEKYRTHKKFRGVRHVVQDEPDDDFVVRAEVLKGLRVLEAHQVPFDFLVYPRQLKHAVTLAERFPALPIVIDHLGKPNIKEHRMEGWRRDFEAAARYDNVYCKLSGMVTEADWTTWTADHLRPFVEIALECFGAKRCMYGSDWPVCLLAADYSNTVGALRTILSELSPLEKRQIFGENAAKFYGLNALEESQTAAALGG